MTAMQDLDWTSPKRPKEIWRETQCSNTIWPSTLWATIYKYLRYQDTSRQFTITIVVHVISCDIIMFLDAYSSITIKPPLLIYVWWIWVTWFCAFFHTLVLNPVKVELMRSKDKLRAYAERPFKAPFKTWRKRPNGRRFLAAIPSGEKITTKPFIENHVFSDFFIDMLIEAASCGIFAWGMRIMHWSLWPMVIFLGMHFSHLKFCSRRYLVEVCSLGTVFALRRDCDRS